MSKNLRRMVTFGLVVTMGILPMSAHSNIVSAQGQEETKTLIMTREDDIDSFDDLDGMTLDLSDKNIVPDDSGKVEIDVNDAVQQGNMARNMIKGNLSFVIEGFNFKKMNGVSSINRPIQNIYVMNNEIYVTQTYTINDNRERQGIAIDNSLNIYIVCDGNGTYNTRADLCVIFKKSKKTIYYSIYGSVSEILYYLGDTISSSEELELEIEGLQIINDKIYMGISPKAENQRNRAFIYYIDNGLIHE